MGGVGEVKNQFDVGAFSAVPKRTGDSCSFPLRVEGYDLTGKLPMVMGVDMASGERVKVFLRDSKNARRSEVRHFATNPYANLSEGDFRNPSKMAEISDTREAKCFTPVGGILMVQGAFDDTAQGAVSASWINRVSTGDAKHGIVLPAVWARLNKPYSKDASKRPWFAVDTLHVDKQVGVETLADLERALFDALAMSATEASAQHLAAVVVRRADGKFGVQMVPRRFEKVEGSDQYVAEAPAQSIARFWAGMPPAVAEGFRQGLESGELEVLVVPGTTYRFVSQSLDALEKPAASRLDTHWERFQLSEDVGSGAGWILSAVTLRPHRGTGDTPAGDEDWYPTGVFPVKSMATPVPVFDIPFFA